MQNSAGRILRIKTGSSLLRAIWREKADELACDYFRIGCRRNSWSWSTTMGENKIRALGLRASQDDSVSVLRVAIALPLLLIAPAIWNGYPLLQYDTGGYLARWYEGYLVPSRSTVFGLYLHFGGSYF
jgi:hypothetical protein